MGQNLNKLLIWFRLRPELEDYDSIYKNIETGIVFKGTNLWILMFAIVLASVGLNVNSTAVIIGAMLISPLMGPIIGIGYSLAIYDFALLRRSIKNFSFAVGASLITSTIYFFLSPLNEAHSELLARTSPTIYDVIIALFGGLAGVVAMSSKLKGNVIPGVAIATALMPPICTAGFGLATFKLNFFFGAIYLFTINTVFIAFAVLVVCQLLKFPIHSNIDAVRKKSVNRTISAVIAITLIPSIFFGYKLVNDEKFSKNFRLFVNDVSVVDGNYLQGQTVNVSQKKIELLYSGYGMDPSVKQKIKEKAVLFHLDSSKVVIKKGFEVDVMQENAKKFQSETDKLNNQLAATSFSLQRSEHRIDSLVNIPMLGQTILRELKPLYPQILSCAYSETVLFTAENDSLEKSEKIPMIVVLSKKHSLTPNDKIKLENWLKSRLNVGYIKAIFEEQ